EVEARAFVPLGPAPQPHPPKKPRCEFGKKLAPKMEKGCTTALHYGCVKRKINKDCLLTIGNTCEIELESICKASADDSINNVKTQIHVNPCSWGWEIRKEKGKDKLFCLPHPRRSIRRSAVAGLKEGDLPESAKRDVPAAVEYYSASTSTSTPSSDVTLNYLKCKDFCKFDKSSPPTCLPNCYVIDGQIQLDAPLLLISPPATVTNSEASIDTSMSTFQTSTTSAVPMDTLLASREHIGEKSLDKREDVVPDPMPNALTDRTNTPAINTAAFRKLDGDILAAITVEAAKKVGNKAAGHSGKRTENGFDVSDPAPKGSTVEDSYAEGEDKEDKRAIHERGLDVSQNLPQAHPLHTLYGGDRVDNYNGKRAKERGFDHMPYGHPNEDMFDKKRKDRRGGLDDTSRGEYQSDADFDSDMTDRYKKSPPLTLTRTLSISAPTRLRLTNAAQQYVFSAAPSIP
ncbi:MAG: hypothetical protein Q9198_008166, partial [Flavoplaca austrocitrina]